ncbi:MAG: hypothetical protein SFW67_15675 [Myxococcaceae bacterium]|nr:hypothetical protein [Myxococcaceae bacterium]
MNRALMPLALCCLVSCAFDDSVSPVSIRCRGDAQCPSRHVCRVDLERCVSLAGDVVEASTVSPPRATTGTLVTAEVTLVRRAENVRVWAASSRGDLLGVFAPVSGDGQRFTFQWTVDVALEEDEALVLADVTTSGEGTSLGHELGGIELDTRGPRPLLSRVELVRSADNPLVAGGQGSQLARATGGGRVSVSFATDEPLDPSTEARVVVEALVGAGRVALVRGPDVAGRLVFTGALPRDAAEGAWQARALLTDLVGNQVDVALEDTGFLVDRTAPAVPDTRPRGAIVFRRAPSGDRRGPAPAFSLRGQAGSTEGPGAIRVRVNGLPGPMLRVRADGSFGPGDLELLTSPLTLEVSAVDLAGNTSPWVAVVDEEVVLSRGNGPLSFFQTGAQARCLMGGAVPLRDAGTSLEAADDDVFEVASGWAAREQLTDDGLGTRRPRLVFDAFAGALYAAGPSLDGTGAWAGRFTGSGWTGAVSSARWPGVAMGFLRNGGLVINDGARRSGLIPGSCGTAPGQAAVLGAIRGGVPLTDEQRVATAWDPLRGILVSVPDQPQAGSPRPQAGASLVFDAARRQLVYTHGQGAPTTWVLPQDGAWTERFPQNVPGPRVDAVAGFDAHRGRVWLIGGRWGGLVLDDAWTWDGADWSREAATPGPVANGAVAFDPVSRRLVLVAGRGGSSEFAPPVTFALADAGWVPLTQAAPTPAGPRAAGLTRMTFSVASTGRLTALVTADVSTQTNTSCLFGASRSAWQRAGGVWQPVPASLPAIDSNTIAEDDQGPFLVGGRLCDGGFPRERFRLDGGAWQPSSEPLLPELAGRLNTVAATGAGTLVIAGGVRTDQSRSVDAFVLETGVWRSTPWSAGSPSLSWHGGLGSFVSVGGGLSAMRRLEFFGQTPVWSETPLRFPSIASAGAVIEEPSRATTLALGVMNGGDVEALEWSGQDLATARPVLAGDVFRPAASYVVDAANQRALRVEPGPFGTSVSTISRAGTTPAFLSTVTVAAALPNGASMQSFAVWARAGASGDGGVTGVALEFSTLDGWERPRGTTAGAIEAPRERPGPIEWSTFDQRVLEAITVNQTIGVAVVATASDAVLAVDAIEMTLGYRRSSDGGVP